MKKKLQLNRETIQNLSPQRLGAIDGASISDFFKFSAKKLSATAGSHVSLSMAVSEGLYRLTPALFTAETCATEGCPTDPPGPNSLSCKSWFNEAAV